MSKILRILDGCNNLLFQRETGKSKSNVFLNAGLTILPIHASGHKINENQVLDLVIW